MFKVVFKGKDVEPMYLDEDKGKKVLDLFLKNASNRVVVNNYAFCVSDVKSVVKTEVSRAESAAKHPHSDKEYMEYRKKMLALPIERRANILRIPKMIWAAHTDQSLDEKTKKEIVARQHAFFTENPNHIYANPSVYRDLIPLPTGKLDKSGIKKISQLTPVSMMRFIENAISLDGELALQSKR